MDSGRTRDHEDDNAPYLPERYRRHVNARRQQKLIKKILIVAAAIVVILAFGLVLSGGFSGLQVPALPALPPSQATPATPASSISPKVTATVSPDVNITVPAAPAIVLGPGIQEGSADSGLLSLETAIDLMHLEYPLPDYTLASVNLTGQSGKKIYEFVIQPHAGIKSHAGIMAGIDAATGEPYTAGQESVKISAAQAKRILGTAFPYLKPDQIRVRYTNVTDSPRSWVFVLVKDNSGILSGSLDPETGQITSFSLKVSPADRPANPILSMTDAQKIADRTITGWNGQLPIKMNSGLYESSGKAGLPVAGRYVFEYNRIIQDQPCDVDGFTLAVDSVSGEVTGYERRWSDPDNAFSVASDSLVAKRDATFIVLQNASGIAPASVQSMQVLSARLLWKDLHAPGQTPRPGTIPLAWKVTFDDDILRARQPPVVATAWIDAQTGAILDMNFHH
ncbi:hypothetical protein [uncultured Methanoregula sp.]|uniref:hypothetical protein n=1 Tax=uncultured Methanoregula sp. TaxID=1005933 RepID=UPI002AAAB779|nr:hypothetical protein [uncultured Methanoregula sp.]